MILCEFISQMKICSAHYYCSCLKKRSGSDITTCHYCRKKKTMYRRHFICIDCCHGWKTQHESDLVGDVEGAQLRRISRENSETASPACSHCGIEGDEVGMDFRIPKQNDKKTWKQMRQDKDLYGDHYSRHMIEMFTYNCGGAYFQPKNELLFDKRMS